MSHNTMIHGIVRPVVRVAARTRLRPNHVTSMRLATGLAAAMIFALGSPGWMILGGAIFVVSMLLDRADGELARQTNRMSLLGHRYDLSCDFIVSIATFVGLGIGATHTAGPIAFWLGALAAVGIGILFFELNMAKLASVRGHDLFGRRITVDLDDAMILVPILIWCDWVWPMIVAAAVITPLAALGVGALSLRGRRA
jgi:archaetidylinositol phosphate synthase